MDPTLKIAMWGALFLGSHLVISSDAVRPALIARIGAQPYRGLYSLVAFATLVPLIVTFAHHKHAGLMLWYLRGIPLLRWLTWLMMLIAFIILVGGLINPNPGSIGAPANRGVHGMLKITRHGFFVAIVLWALAHLLMNGWAGDICFFGSLAALGILGGWHQDRRKLVELGEPYREFVAATSFFPFAALVSGRQRWTRTDMPWAALVIGTVSAFAVMRLHPILFGGNPLG
ncbi:MAG TPA: NnrU family protein [Candidatus Binataceae bacterium]|nr:NnrU family protein [Candidatus Binataceae bacterium]